MRIAVTLLQGSFSRSSMAIFQWKKLQPWIKWKWTNNLQTEDNFSIKWPRKCLHSILRWRNLPSEIKVPSRRWKLSCSAKKKKKKKKKKWDLQLFQVLLNASIPNKTSWEVEPFLNIQLWFGSEAFSEPPSPPPCKHKWMCK